VDVVRAFYRGYSQRTGHRAAQVRRLHLMREDGKWAGRQAYCGVHGWAVRDSDPIILDPPPQVPPTGLTWCGACVGRAAEHTGQLNAWAAQLATGDAA
jgi:hypothetical protein